MLVHFNTSIPKNLHSSETEKLYDAEIPALVGLVLSMANDEVESIMKGEGEDRIEVFKLKK